MSDCSTSRKHSASLPPTYSTAYAEPLRPGAGWSRPCAIRTAPIQSHDLAAHARIARRFGALAWRRRHTHPVAERLTPTVPD